jgi:hypothetical protein
MLTNIEEDDSRNFPANQAVRSQTQPDGKCVNSINCYSAPSHIAGCGGGIRLSRRSIFDVLRSTSIAIRSAITSLCASINLTQVLES